VASSDLGGLGSRDGSPVACAWVLPGVTPLLLPWLAILGLLALKPNRSGAAWWIWLPLGCVVAPALAPVSILPNGANFFLDAIAALAVGLAAVWLLSDTLRQRHRLLTFLRVIAVLAGFSALAFVAGQGWSLVGNEAIGGGIALGLGVLATSVALSLDGLACRRRYRPLGNYLWLLVLLAATWLVLTALFFLIGVISGAGRPDCSQLVAVVLVAAAVNFATLLPFLVLSSASPLFRERLKALLNVTADTPPPLSAPSPEANLKT